MKENRGIGQGRAAVTLRAAHQKEISRRDGTRFCLRESGAGGFCNKKGEEEAELGRKIYYFLKLWL
jgi:hypothetical protein